MNKIEKIWYPGELAPQLYYINKELRAMATALVRTQGASPKWEAFDMQKRNSADDGPLFLGEHESVDLARQQIEKLVL